MTPADIKQWRASLGLSQREAADALGVTLPTYQAWERGINLQTKQPLSVKIMRRAAMHIREFADTQE
jgi:DNA-binding transcriptional regulator YiaG